MKGLQISSLILCLAFNFPATNSYAVDNGEQSLIDYLINRGSQQAQVQHDEKMNELGREDITSSRQHNLQADKSKSENKYHLIKKSAIAIVQRLTMPSPPAVDVLIDKAVHFVIRKTMVQEYVQIRSGIKELVDKMLSKNMHNEEHQEPRIESSKTSPGVREEKILIAMEEILQELGIRLNLTTPQIKKLVDISVKVLARHLGLSPSQREELHERVTSQLRKMLDIEDEDNKDARLRRLEERIENDIEKFKLSAKQVKRLEELMVEEEAIEEGLTKEEKKRMLKRVYADVIDDLRAQRTEQNARPPVLTDIRLTAISNMIRQKALEMELTKEELKLLGLAILTAVEHLSNRVKPTQEAHTNSPTLTRTTTTPNPKSMMKSTADVVMTTRTIKTTKPVTLDTDTSTHGHNTQARTSQRPPTTHARATKPITSQRTTTHPHETEQKSTKRTPTTHARETEPTSHRASTAHVHITENISTKRNTTHARETKSTASHRATTAHVRLKEQTSTKRTPTTHVRGKEPRDGQRKVIKDKTDLDAKLAQDEAELEGKDFAKRLNVDDETKAEELELELERKMQDKEELKMKAADSIPRATMPTNGEVTESLSRSLKVTDAKPSSSKHPNSATKSSAKPKHVAQGVTHSSEKVTKALDLTTSNLRTKPTTKHVTLKVVSVTQSKEELDKEKLEDLLEGLPTHSQVTKPENHAKEVTQPTTEDFAKELKSFIEKKQLHSRKNHELLHDEIEMRDLGVRKEHGDTSLEDELKLTEYKHLNKEKRKSLAEELHEILKTKNQEIKKLEDELEDL